WEEAESLRSQFVTLKEGASRSQFVTLKQGQHIKYLPYAFTEQGVAMLSSVLKSRRAIRMNIAIMRAFVRLKQMMLINKDLADKIGKLERKVGKHDKDIQAIVEAIRGLISPAPNIHQKPKREIGFHAKSERKSLS
ncbi:MAG: ORF6N domain-containing protein, partial [Candidatus Omnitrophota bacterium]